MILETVDRSLFNAVNASQSSPHSIASLEVLAEAPIWLLPILVAAAWLIGVREDRYAAVMATVAACLAMTVAHIASVIVDHPRPFMVGLAPNLLHHADDSSFPSDHTTLFFAVAVAFFRRPLSRCPGLGGLLAMLGLCVGFSRVALGVHFPMDVLGAIAIGAVAPLIIDVGFRPVVDVVFGIGERLRQNVGPLATLDRRQSVAGADARPAR